MDLDEDGDIDIVSAADDTVAWYENTGNQVFSTANVISNTASGVQDIEVIDMDGDGYLDIVSASYYNDTVEWYKNDGQNNFPTTNIITDQAVGAYQVFPVDVDGDGDIDMMVTSQMDTTFAWYENDGSGSFTNHFIANPNDRPQTILGRDIDKDGDIDVVTLDEKALVSYRFDGIYIYDNDTWTPATPMGNANPEDDVEVRSGATVFDTNLEILNLEVNAGATLAIEDVLKVNGDLINNGDVTFKSTATGNGELGPVQPGASIIGDFTVERYLTGHRAYRMVSSAVNTTGTIHQNWQENANSNVDNPVPGYGTHITGTTIDQTDGFDATPSGNPSLFTLDVANQSFAVVANTDQTTLNAGSPFLLFSRGDRSIDVTSNEATPTSTVLRATGQLLTGDVTQTFSTTNANDFIMFGNPYQATVDLNEVISESTNINANQYYVFDPSLGDHGAYVTVLLPSGSTTGSSTANQYLQPGAGAQIATINNGSASLL
ncbi:FG-GAP repeat domain-containing protein [Mesonia maritima]|uniref:FG-GAP repeat domain-containing protein n=1 Tax=Mesonia maritima TaxID=1793873 RepID=UPI003641403D